MARVKIIQDHPSGLSEGEIYNLKGWVALDLINRGIAVKIDQEGNEIAPEVPEIENPNPLVSEPEVFESDKVYAEPEEVIIPEPEKSEYIIEPKKHKK